MMQTRAAKVNVMTNEQEKPVETVEDDSLVKAMEEERSIEAAKEEGRIKTMEEAIKEDRPLMQEQGFEYPNPEVMIPDNRYGRWGYYPYYLTMDAYNGPYCPPVPPGSAMVYQQAPQYVQPTLYQTNVYQTNAAQMAVAPQLRAAPKQTQRGAIFNHYYPAGIGSLANWYSMATSTPPQPAFFDSPPPNNAVDSAVDEGETPPPRRAKGMKFQLSKSRQARMKAIEDTKEEDVRASIDRMGSERLEDIKSDTVACSNMERAEIQKEQAPNARLLKHAGEPCAKGGLCTEGHIGLVWPTYGQIKIGTCMRICQVCGWRSRSKGDSATYLRGHVQNNHLGPIFVPGAPHGTTRLYTHVVSENPEKGKGSIEAAKRRRSASAAGSAAGELQPSPAKKVKLDEGPGEKAAEVEETVGEGVGEQVKGAEKAEETVEGAEKVGE